MQPTDTLGCHHSKFAIHVQRNSFKTQRSRTKCKKELFMIFENTIMEKQKTKESGCQTHQLWHSLVFHCWKGIEVFWKLFSMQSWTPHELEDWADINFVVDCTPCHVKSDICFPTHLQNGSALIGFNFLIDSVSISMTVVCNFQPPFFSVLGAGWQDDDVFKSSMNAQLKGWFLPTTLSFRSDSNFIFSFANHSQWNSCKHTKISFFGWFWLQPCCILGWWGCRDWHLSFLQ